MADEMKNMVCFKIYHSEIKPIIEKIVGEKKFSMYWFPKNNYTAVEMDAIKNYLMNIHRYKVSNINRTILDQDGPKLGLRICWH